jgi:hypothetical protein
VSSRDALLSAARSIFAGATVALPDGQALLWHAFVALSRTRRTGINGPEAISYAEVLAYCQLTRLPLEPHHVETIMAIDWEWLSRATGAALVEQGSHPSPPISVALFDAVFG